MLLPIVIILVIQQLLNVKEIRDVVERKVLVYLDFKLVLAGKACPFGHKKATKAEEGEDKKREETLEIQKQ